MGFTYSLFSLYLVNLTTNPWFFICIYLNIFTLAGTTYPPSDVSTLTFTLNKRLVPHIKITCNIVPRLIELGFVCLVAITTIAFRQRIQLFLKGNTFRHLNGVNDLALHISKIHNAVQNTTSLYIK